MISELHILNGDALKEQFPDSVSGETIIARECLIDGPVSAETLEDFFSVRSNYLNNQYSGVQPDYSEDVIPEFKKITELSEEASLIYGSKMIFSASLISGFAVL